MSAPNQKEMTILLNAAAAGETAAPEKLFELVYDDLRRLAVKYMRNERGEHTLQATALVHEAFIRLIDWENVSWQNRAHFFACAAQIMRKILVDHARHRNAQKRGGQKLALDEAVSFTTAKEFDLVVLGEALDSLEKIDPRQARIVILRFFGGLSIEETAHVLKVSETTVRREWTFAKAWFQRELTRN